MVTRRYCPHPGIAMILCLVFIGMLQPAEAVPSDKKKASVAASDTVKAGRYDNGKMWTFEYPPLNYLEETYGFKPDAEWLERAQMSALRIPGCSAAFVSPNGLVATNHHCVRARVSAVSRPDEDLLDNGFYAGSVDEERRIPGYYADQLIAIEDVTDEVYAALEGQETAAERAQAREDAIEAVEERILANHDSDNVWVQVISLYNGGRYSAYIFHRYTDVRLVMAVELQLGFFGGEPDNFTYPRYALDFSFLRIYGEDGKPLQTPFFFPWSQQGVQEGDLVFVIGNPGSTSRLATVSQLEFFRDVFVKHSLRVLNNRLSAMRDFYEKNPEAGEAIGIRNIIFSASNSQKAYDGRQKALNDPMLIARRADGERQFREAIDADADLKARYGDLFERVADIQQQKAALGAEYGAFRWIEHTRYAAPTIRRAIQAYRYLSLQKQGADEAGLSETKEALLGIGDLPVDLERRMLAARFSEFRYHLGAESDRVLGDKAPEAAATALLESSVLATAAGTREAVAQGTLTMDDPALRMAASFMPRYRDFQSAYNGLTAQEGELKGALGQARFDVYGTDVPPDATFSPRFTDGVVKSYAYNGTLAPPYTTFYGLYNRYYAHQGEPDWMLPERWHTPHEELNLATPLNFISTSDTIGGNSGSPVVTRNLEVVGFNFDRNIEGLSRDYIYLPDRGRNMAVDGRAVLEALDVMYDADRLVLELKEGELIPTEAEADAR